METRGEGRGERVGWMTRLKREELLQKFEGTSPWFVLLDGWILCLSDGRLLSYGLVEDSF